MDAGDGVKRIGRADQPQQLAGRAGSLRALLLSRRSFSTFSCRYSFAEPQPQRHDEWTRTSKYAWRVVLSMHISNGSSPQPVARPVALQNPRRSGVRKTGAPSRFSYSGAVPPTYTGLGRPPCVVIGRDRGAGEELTVAHGGWRSLAHRRYDRFQLSEVL